MKTILALCALTALAAAPSLAQSGKSPKKDVHVAAATCVGADPCRACKNCKYCKRCNDGSGRTCGICNAKRNRQTRTAQR